MQASTRDRSARGCIPSRVWHVHPLTCMACASPHVYRMCIACAGVHARPLRPRVGLRQGHALQGMCMACSNMHPVHVYTCAWVGLRQGHALQGEAPWHARTRAPCVYAHGARQGGRVCTACSNAHPARVHARAHAACASSCVLHVHGRALPGGRARLDQPRPPLDYLWMTP